MPQPGIANDRPAGAAPRNPRYLREQIGRHHRAARSAPRNRPSRPVRSKAVSAPPRGGVIGARKRIGEICLETARVAAIPGDRDRGEPEAREQRREAADPYAEARLLRLARALPGEHHAETLASPSARTRDHSRPCCARAETAGARTVPRTCASTSRIVHSPRRDPVTAARGATVPAGRTMEPRSPSPRARVRRARSGRCARQPVNDQNRRGGWSGPATANRFRPLLLGPEARSGGSRGRRFPRRVGQDSTRRRTVARAARTRSR